MKDRCILRKSRAIDNRIHFPNKNTFRDNKIQNAVLFIHRQKETWLAFVCQLRGHMKKVTVSCSTYVKYVLQDTIT